MPPVSPFASSSSRSQSGEAGGTSFLPVEDVELRGALPPKLPSSPAFYFKAHPNRWQILDGKILPTLGRLPLRAGVAGVQAGRRKGSVSLRAARTAQEERGWRLIPFDAVPPSHVEPGAEPSYLQRLEQRPDVVLSIYERAFPGSSETAPDRERWVEFLEHLVAQGYVDPPATHTLERMVQTREKHLDRARNRAMNEPSYKADVERIEGELETLRAELKKRQRKARPARAKAVVPTEED